MADFKKAQTETQGMSRGEKLLYSALGLVLSWNVASTVVDGVKINEGQAKCDDQQAKINIKDGRILSTYYDLEDKACKAEILVDDSILRREIVWDPDKTDGAPCL